MKLSLIWEVDRTIDTSGSSPLARLIAARWQHDRDSVQFFRSSANFLYLVRCEGEPCFLRLAPAAERRREEVEAELSLLQWLAGEGLPVVRPVPSRENHLLESVESPWGLFHAAMFVGVPGEQFDSDEIDDNRFRSWGAALGQLHATLRHHPEAESLPRGSWQEHLNQAKPWIPADAVTVRKEAAWLESTLDALPKNRDTFGLIHGDFELDNLVWQDQTASCSTSTTAIEPGSPPISRLPFATGSTRVCRLRTQTSGLSSTVTPASSHFRRLRPRRYRYLQDWRDYSSSPGLGARLTLIHLWITLSGSCARRQTASSQSGVLHVARGWMTRSRLCSRTKEELLDIRQENVTAEEGLHVVCNTKRRRCSR